METTQNIITLNTGDVTYAINNEFGETIGTIRFNPADVDLVRRCERVAEFFRDNAFPKNGTTEQFYEYTDKIKEQFDFVLNRKVSDEIFKVCNPLTLLADGTYFYVSVLDAIMDIVRTETKKRAEESARRVEEAVAELTENE